MQIFSLPILNSNELEIIKKFNEKNNMGWSFIIKSSEHFEVDDVIVSFDYDLKHCGDTKEDKKPTHLIFEKVIGRNPNDGISFTLPSIVHELDVDDVSILKVNLESI